MCQQRINICQFPVGVHAQLDHYTDNDWSRRASVTKQKVCGHHVLIKIPYPCGKTSFLLVLWWAPLLSRHGIKSLIIASLCRRNTKPCRWLHCRDRGENFFCPFDRCRCKMWVTFVLRLAVTTLLMRRWSFKVSAMVTFGLFPLPVGRTLTLEFSSSGRNKIELIIYTFFQTYLHILRSDCHGLTSSDGPSVKLTSFGPFLITLAGDM